MYKKCNARCKVVVLPINPIVFMMFSLPSRHWILKSLLCIHRRLYFFFQASAIGVFGAVPDPILGGGMSRIVGDSEQGNEYNLLSREQTYLND